MTFLFIISGVFGLLLSKNSILNEVSVGILVFGIGLIGLIKTAIEMFENHRLDKKTEN